MALAEAIRSGRGSDDAARKGVFDDFPNAQDFDLEDQRRA
jgi:hypothetical protein